MKSNKTTEFTFYKVLLYVDDGINLDYKTPHELHENDVFISKQEAWDWAQEHNYDDCVVIMDYVEPVITIGDYNFKDVDCDPLKQAVFKLKTIGQVLGSTKFSVDGNIGFVERNGLFFKSEFWTWNELRKVHLHIMEDVLGNGVFETNAANKYSLTKDQKQIVDEAFRLLEEADKQDVGFYYDMSSHQIHAFNAENVMFMKAVPGKSQGEISNQTSTPCTTTCYAHMDSNKEHFTIVNKTHE